MGLIYQIHTCIAATGAVAAGVEENSWERLFFPFSIYNSALRLRLLILNRRGGPDEKELFWLILAVGVL